MHRELCTKREHAVHEENRELRRRGRRSRTRQSVSERAAGDEIASSVAQRGRFRGTMQPTRAHQGARKRAVWSWSSARRPAARARPALRNAVGRSHGRASQRSFPSAPFAARGLPACAVPRRRRKTARGTRGLCVGEEKERVHEPLQSCARFDSKPSSSRVSPRATSCRDAHRAARTAARSPASAPLSGGARRGSKWEGQGACL